MNRSTVVRPGHAEDLPAILSIEAQCGSVTWSPDGFHTTLSDETTWSLVATAPDNTVRGFILAQVAADECTVHTIGVLPSCQRHGIGTMLLNGLIMHAERLGCAMMFLEVRSKKYGRTVLLSLPLDLPPAEKGKGITATTMMMQSS